MALPELHPLSETQIAAFSSQIGASPVAAYVRAPVRGKILKVGVVQGSAVNGTSITGGAIAVTGGGAGSHFSAVPTALNDVNEDDVISFTPAGATGSAVAHCYAVIRRA